MENNKIIFKIENYIWKNFNLETDSSLFTGLSGFILFYDSMHLAFPNLGFEEKLIAIIEKTNALIEENQNSINLSSGIAGYGLALLRLKSKNVEIGIEYFDNIDEIILEDFEQHYNSNGFDYMH